MADQVHVQLRSSPPLAAGGLPQAVLQAVLRQLWGAALLKAMQSCWQVQAHLQGSASHLGSTGRGFSHR